MCTRKQRWTVLLILVLALACLATTSTAEDQDGDYGLLLRSEDGVEPAPVLGQIIQVQVTGIVARARVLGPRP